MIDWPLTPRRTRDASAHQPADGGARCAVLDDDVAGFVNDLQMMMGIGSNKTAGRVNKWAGQTAYVYK